MGPLGDVGSPGQLAGQAWLVHTPGHPAVLLQHSPPPPQPRYPHGCSAASPPGLPPPVWRREGPWVRPDPLCPWAWCQQDKAASQAKSRAGAPALAGSGGTAAAVLPRGSHPCSASPVLSFDISNLPAPQRASGSPAGPRHSTWHPYHLLAEQGVGMESRCFGCPPPTRHGTACLVAVSLCGPLCLLHAEAWHKSQCYLRKSLSLMKFWPPRREIPVKTPQPQCQAVGKWLPAPGHPQPISCCSHLASHTLHPASFCILQPEICTLYPSTFVPRPSSHILPPAACIPQPAPCSLHSASCILQPLSCILQPASCILLPRPCTP